jgi:phage tail sheath protein FI
MGSNTLQAKPSALDRINVRRLMIALKKFIASASQYLVFEQNTSATRNRFLNIVNPYMESVQQRQGIYAFKVVMDDTNNTPDLIDRNIMYGQIYLQPTRTAEFIIIDFNKAINNVIEIEVYDAIGKLVLAQTSSNNRTIISLEQLAKGIYNVRLKDNGSYTTIRVIKE